ncbi:transcriptional regulator, MarR family protein [Methanocaldococcus villosus KIN24-T80]|uniref:Transcriptional regulator, MarR family protein n=1 Tax=Methanocaldococcus villosus KIN24-T80 TaxID=1069083 RepID=N6V2Z5_9EURY|nr:transcriptional regulator, MarR family protein [Methanocaldococcus villosus KIN24-T80]
MLILLLFLPNILAYQIENENIVCFIHNNNLLENITLEFKNFENNKSTFYITLPQNVKILNISSNYPIDGYSAVFQDGTSNIAVAFEKPLPINKTVSLTLTCLVKDCIWKGYDYYQFITNFPIIGKNVKIKLYLPPGAVIVYPNLITPEGYEITGDGKHQIIVWNLKPKSEFIMTTSLRFAYAPYTPITNKEKKDNNIIIFLILLSGSIAFVAYERFKRIKINKEKNQIYDNYLEIKGQLAEKNKQISDLEDKCRFLEEEVGKLKNIIEEKDKVICEMSKKVEEYLKEIKLLGKEKEDLINNITELKAKIEKLKDENEKLKNIIDKYKDSEKGILLNFLTDDEKKIIKLIKEHKYITQKDIVSLTRMSKSKVSRIVSELEERGIVKKEKVGRINMLTLTDEADNLI